MNAIIASYHPLVNHNPKRSKEVPPPSCLAGVAATSKETAGRINSESLGVHKSSRFFVVATTL